MFLFIFVSQYEEKQPVGGRNRELEGKNSDFNFWF